MAQVRAFRGLRYDLARVGALADVIAPPYDVIDDALSDSLHARHENNVIRLILNRINPTDNEQDNRYTRTARLLKQWQREGIFSEERDPALYAYYQTFNWEGLSFTRRGFMSRVRLEPFGTGKIFPHEETMPGPKADRLKLFHATGLNLSPVFGLFPDEANEIASALDEAVMNQTPLEAVDHLDVVHRMWVVTDPMTIHKIEALMGLKPVFIADGHHRYETGLRHLEERKAAGQVAGPEDPANFILMMFVGMNDPGLQVMPTHRLISGLQGMDGPRLGSLLKEHFDVEELGSGSDAGRRCWQMIVDSGRQEKLGFCTTSDKSWRLATLRSPASMDKIVTDHSAVWKGLGVSILHRLVIDHALASVGTPACKYVHLADEVFTAVDAKQCDVACLVQPATVEHIRTLAGTLEKMPAKSTYFYPKLASGLVFNPIH